MNRSAILSFVLGSLSIVSVFVGGTLVGSRAHQEPAGPATVARDADLASLDGLLAQGPKGGGASTDKISW